MIRLTIQQGDQTRVVEAAEPLVTLGRTRANTVHIDDAKLSREHCRIERTADGGYRLADLDSSNGTFLNGERVREHALADGDRILIGKTVISVELPGGAPRAAAPAEPPAARVAEAREPLPLLFTAGPEKGKSCTLTADLTTLGRQHRNDLVIDDPGASNHHAEIRREAEGFVLVDAGSRNGTFLNGSRVTRAVLKPGDEIRIGLTVLRVAGAAAEPVAPAPAAPAVQEPPPQAEAAPQAPAPAPAAEEPLASTAEARAPGARVPGSVVAVAAAVILLGVGAVLVLRGMRRTPRPDAGAAATTATESGVAGEGAAKDGPQDTAQSTKEAVRPAEHPSDEDEARRRAEEASRALRRIDEALRLLERAKLTEQAADFEAARAALTPLVAALRGTPHETRLADALALCDRERAGAAQRRREALATAILQAARQHQALQQPAIARLHCEEILTQFPTSAAATQAKALLDDLDRAPAPAPPKAVPPPAKAAPPEPKAPPTAPKGKAAPRKTSPPTPPPSLEPRKP